MNRHILSTPRRRAHASAPPELPPRNWDVEGAALMDVLAPVGTLPSTPFGFLRFLIRRHAAWPMGAMLLCALAASVFDSLGPYMLARGINGLNSSGGVQVALPWFLGLGGAILGSILSFRLYEFIDIHVCPRLRALTQNYLFGYLLGHSPRYFQNNFAGKLGQKIKQAGHGCLSIISIICLEVVYLTGLMTVSGVLFFQVQPLFAAALIGWALFYLTVSALLARRGVGLSRALSEEMTTSTGRLIDAISNADIVRAFAKALQERRLLSMFLAREMMASQRLRTFLLAMRLFQSLASLGFLALVVAVAMHEVVQGRMSIGVFTMVFVLGNTLTSHIRTLSNRMLEFFEQLGILTEAITLVGEPHEITDRPNAPALVVREGAIDFQHVRFAHGDGGPVFADLNLSIRPGEKIGLVGPSGAGKSTLVKLLRRQYEPQSGRILIDGQDITEVTWDSLNEAIAEVPQLPGVFHRPVRDNIRYARNEADEGEVIEAAEKAHAHDFISRRAERYDTIVGEQGIKLSGGERQRVAIARALIKDARILVLDEATSSLDSESEHLIQEALWTVMQGRTVIAIAHRLSTIVGMDRIVYLEAGRILEAGSHDELIARQGAYARLWSRQVGGFLNT